MAELRVVGADPPPGVAVAARFASLEDVIAWGEIVEIVVQDEYTHDVIVRGPPPAYLCFDTT